MQNMALKENLELATRYTCLNGFWVRLTQVLILSGSVICLIVKVRKSRFVPKLVGKTNHSIYIPLIFMTIHTPRTWSSPSWAARHICTPLDVVTDTSWECGSKRKMKDKLSDWARGKTLCSICVYLSLIIIKIHTLSTIYYLAVLARVCRWILMVANTPERNSVSFTFIHIWFCQNQILIFYYPRFPTELLCT